MLAGWTHLQWKVALKSSFDRGRSVSILIWLFLLVGCTSTKPSESSESHATDRKCVEPENPYSEGTGHYAGYEWAERNGGTCSAASQSFNEGCEEYEAQESEYDECEAEKRK